jgi:GNAT superfamily N-acetyltransferase
VSSGAALRDFRPDDAAALDRVALAAFAQFAPEYDDWPAMAAGMSSMSALAGRAELIVAEIDGRIAGGVGYVPPHAPKAAYFDPSWPVMRMLVVDPAMRGRGIGRALAEACVARARRDGAPVLALHTTPIMRVALPMYMRMGFVRIGDAPPIHGVPYGVCVLALEDAPQTGAASVGP